MSSFASRAVVVASVSGLVGLGMAGAVGGLGACSGGSSLGVGEGGTSGTSGTSGASGTSGTSEAGLVDGAASACTPLGPPAGAVNGVSLFFGALGATDGTSTGWASRGFDRDGLCTTTASTDVCNRQGGAAASYQEDGNDGIDNAWGHVITPFLKQLDPTEPSGYLVTDSTGKGTLVLGIQGTRINVPITFARVVRNGTTATVSAVIPTEAFVTEMGRVAGHLSTSLCDGSTLDSIKQSIRQASDVPLDLAQDPSVACSAITLGAILTNVTDDTPSPIGPQPDPCL